MDDKGVKQPADVAAPKPPDMAAEATKLMHEAMDNVTKETVARLDGLIKELEAMKTFVTKDADRVKRELGAHMIVRNKANELAGQVRKEIDSLHEKITNTSSA